MASYNSTTVIDIVSLLLKFLVVQEKNDSVDQHYTINSIGFKNQFILYLYNISRVKFNKVPNFQYFQN